MKRIGIIASKIAKGNPVLYNCYVVLFSFLFSLFVFVVAGSTVVFALVIIAYVGNELMGLEFERSWRSVFLVCMVTLTIVTALFNLCALFQNLKLPGSK